MKSDSYQVLIFSGDDHLTQDLTSRLRSFFSGFPLELEFEPSARRLATGFREKLHDLVILAAGGADSDMPQAILQLQGVSGSARIVYLGVTPLGEGFQGVDSFALPIVQWNAVLGLIGEMVPEHLAQRYHLKRIDNPFRKALEEHAAKLVSTSASVPSSTSGRAMPSANVEGFLLSPLVWKNSPSPARREMKPTALNSGVIDVSEGSASSVKTELDHTLRRQSLRVELSLLAGLLILTTLVHIYWQPDAPEHWVSIKSLLKLLSAASIFGFFASRGVEQILFRKAESKAESQAPSSG